MNRGLPLSAPRAESGILCDLTGAANWAGRVIATGPARCLRLCCPPSLYASAVPHRSRPQSWQQSLTCSQEIFQAACSANTYFSRWQSAVSYRKAIGTRVSCSRRTSTQVFDARTAQLQTVSLSVTCSVRTRGCRSRIGARVPAGSLRWITIVRDVPRGSSTATVYTGCPSWVPIRPTPG